MVRRHARVKVAAFLSVVHVILVVQSPAMVSELEEVKELLYSIDQPPVMGSELEEVEENACEEVKENGLEEAKAFLYAVDDVIGADRTLVMVREFETMKSAVSLNDDGDAIENHLVVVMENVDADWHEAHQLVMENVDADWHEAHRLVMENDDADWIGNLSFDVDHVLPVMGKDFYERHGISLSPYV